MNERTNERTNEQTNAQTYNDERTTMAHTHVCGSEAVLAVHIVVLLVSAADAVGGVGAEVVAGGGVPQLRHRTHLCYTWKHGTISNHEESVI